LIGRQLSNCGKHSSGAALKSVGKGYVGELRNTSES
jgi:hypothetical protein